MTRMAACFACLLAVAGSSLTMAQPSGTVDFKNVEGGHLKLDNSHAPIAERDAAGIADHTA